MTEANGQDLDGWLEQGKGMLTSLEERRGVLQSEIDTVDGKITKARKAMGMAPEGAGSKVMIRSVIKEVLLDAAGRKQLLDEAGVIRAVQALQPRATEASVRTSLARALRKDSWIGENEGQYSYIRA